jgi:hypothetical protein
MRWTAVAPASAVAGSTGPISDIRRPELAATKKSLVRTSRDRLRVAGTGVDSRCTNSSGNITRSVVPSRYGVLNLSLGCLAAMR